MKGFQAIFEVVAPGDVRVTKCQDWEFRGRNCVELLTRLSRENEDLLVGKTGAVSYGDWPPPPEWVSQFDLTFCTTKHLRKASPCLPFPCPYTLRWPEVGIPDADAMMGQLIADESPFESDKIFWIGADTHASRRRLWQLGQEHANFFDVELMEWDRKAPGGQRSKTRQVSIPDHRKFKYLVDCPGYGYSGRLKWLLATGRPVFVLERENVEHWHDELQPWVHFVPVSADLSDLLDHHAKLEKDPDLYEAIASQGRQFAATKLRVDQQLERTKRSMKIQAQPPKPQHSAFRPRKGKKVAMVIARYLENLSWIDSVSEEIDIFIINKGTPFEAAAFQRADVQIVTRPNLGREADSYLSFIEGRYHRNYERLIFSQGDPFSHSPDFLALLSQIDRWSDVQPLGCQWSIRKELPPSHLVATERGNWLGSLKVRKELFSLFTLGTIRYQDRGIIRVLDDYQRFHGLPHGSNIAAHFFSTVGLPDHAQLASEADLGLFTFSALFSVKTDLISRLPQRSAAAMRQLCQQDPLHAYIMERLWLHLFGHPFVRASAWGVEAALSAQEIRAVATV